jgi:hypothetical protein
MKTEIRTESVAYVGMVELLELDPERGYHYAPDTGEILRDNGDGLTLTVVKITE